MAGELSVFGKFKKRDFIRKLVINMGAFTLVQRLALEFLDQWVVLFVC